MEILILSLLIVLNGVFAMSEIALVTARKARLSALAAEGDRRAQAAIRLGEDPARFLSAVQIGITSIGLFSGIVGEAALAAPLALWLESGLGLSASAAGTASTVAVVAGVTYLSIVVGELVPKRLGQLSPEKTACRVARPMELLAMASRPFVALLTASTSLLLRILGARPDDRPSVTEEEIQAMIDESTEAGTLESKQNEMLRNVFRLDDRPATSIMVPRSDIAFIDLDAPPRETLETLRRHHYSWMPLCRGDLGGIVGVVRSSQALLLFTEGLPSAERLSQSLQEMTRPAMFVPETLTSLEILKLFQEKAIRIAFIIDEYGTLEGLVCLRDLLDILAGKSEPESSVWAVRRDDGSWLMDGRIPLPELKDRLGLRALPDEGQGHYSILSGMLMYMTGRIPREGESVDWEGWRLEVIDMDGNRIDKVLAQMVED